MAAYREYRVEGTFPVSTDVGYSGSDDDGGRSHETGRVSLFSLQQTMFRMDKNVSEMRKDIGYMREAQMQRATETERRFNDHEMRIRAFEAKRYLEPKSVTTVAAIVLPICALAVSVVAIIVK